MTGALLFSSRDDDPVDWSRALRARMPELEIRVSPELGDPSQIEAALVWKPPAGELGRLPNLRLVVSLAAGVDPLLEDASLSPEVPIVRLGESGMAPMMCQYVAHAVLRLHRRIGYFERAQRARRWDYALPPAADASRVGVMGLGSLGLPAAQTLAALGFPVAGWARSAKSVPGIECFDGAAGLVPFLARTDILVTLLPLTAATRGLIGRAVFYALPRGARLVSCGRGATLVEADLVAALRDGQIAEAVLDVFEREPLAPDHPFWAMEEVLATPHIATAPVPDIASAGVVENIRRLREGLPLLYLVDRGRGY
ncbi:MAG TPA: glyoxylate/hydroxypyruvate reductase A [Stellaceae bacterium]|nr:glyoxylate/hydroxypyruvate reductase A [Stellaceae bacterium]